MSPPRRNGAQRKQGSGVPKHVPKEAGAPQREKIPRSLHHDDPNVLQRHPVWRFGEFDAEWPPSCPTMDGPKHREAFEKLAHLETQSLGRLWAPDTKHRIYDTGELPSGAARRLQKVEHDDEDQIHTLHLSGKFRVMGFLREHIFYVLWLDPEHEVWPSKKKNT